MNPVRFLSRPVLVCAFVALSIGREAPAAAGPTDTDNLRDALQTAYEEKTAMFHVHIHAPRPAAETQSD